jgi:hypothetical protein
MSALHPPEHVLQPEDTRMVGEEARPEVLLERAMRVVRIITQHLLSKRVTLRSMFSLF